MSASLVGSEMCIRDSNSLRLTYCRGSCPRAAGADATGGCTLDERLRRFDAARARAQDRLDARRAAEPRPARAWAGGRPEGARLSLG
eukprot:10665406-Alexandrium_andersonii.AAC.1